LRKYSLGEEEIFRKIGELSVSAFIKEELK
jgi:hypothetical protein